MKFLLWIWAIIITFLFLIFWFPYYTSETISNAIITSKEVKKTNGVDFYLLYIKDSQWNWKTYKITDNIWHLQYRSSDLYLSVAEWDTITFKNYWFRIPFMSMYENIYDIKVEKSKNTSNNSQNMNSLNNINSNILYFYEKNNIYKYNIESKTVELYQENILK